MAVTSSSAQAAASSSGMDQEELVDAFLAASRALVAVAVRSLANVEEDVTLAQYRVLVELAARGPQRPADLATVLGVDPSTAGRMCDRLTRKQLVLRRRSRTDRRAVWVSLKPAGRQLVDEVSARRRGELSEILERLPSTNLRSTVRALRSFAEAAGQVPEQDWSLGWDTPK